MFITHLRVLGSINSAGSSRSLVPLKLFAEQHGLHVHSAPANTLRDWSLPGEFDFGVVVSFGYFLPKHIIAAFGKGTLNVHPSLLPRYRGGAPIQHALMNGETETGVSIIELHDRAFDAGSILKQVKVNIPPYTNYYELERYLARVGGRELVNVIHDYETMQRNALPQPRYTEELRAPKITRIDARLKWYAMTASEIYHRHLAISHQFPLRCRFRGEDLLLMQVKSADIAKRELQVIKDTRFGEHHPPGTLYYNSITDTLFVACRTPDTYPTQDWIAVKAVKLPKRDVMSPANLGVMNFIDAFD